ncbi:MULTISPECIES: DUF3080 family protein [unclassified Pseudoalteromonas]|uniref:DUF3080 family protein n=1 Tax=unclassified Pseudoalteromonas TaxID=194690 RepID=UPI00390C6B20
MNHLFSLKQSINNTLPLSWLQAVCCVFLFGCSEQPSEANKTYLSRLSSTLQVPEPNTNSLQQLTLIEPVKALQPAIKIGITELAGISQCKLNVLISEHNNQLGKTATAASQLKYQIDFIQSAQNCLNSLDKQSKIYNKIAAAKTQKQAQLTQFFNNMLFSEPELNSSWQLTGQELNTQPAGFSDTVEGLKKLTTIKQLIENQNSMAINSDDILSALEPLNRYKFNQQLIQAAREQISLNHAATQFVNTLTLEDICPKGKNKQQAKIVSNIFNKYYLKQIQPYQAQLSGYLETLQPMYLKLWFNQAVSSEEINALLDPSANNLLTQLKSSAKEHVIWWQKFYKTCEISPI